MASFQKIFNSLRSKDSFIMIIFNALMQITSNNGKREALTLTSQAVSTQLTQLAQGPSRARMEERACSRTRPPPGGGSEKTSQCCTTSFHYSMGSAWTHPTLSPFLYHTVESYMPEQKITFPQISILQRRSPYS